MDPITGAALSTGASNVLGHAATQPAQSAGPSRAESYGSSVSAFDVNSPAFGSFAVGFGSGTVGATSAASPSIAAGGMAGLMPLAYLGAGLVVLLVVIKALK